MRVAIFHNRYLQRGGEDTASDAEAALLAKAGHEVHRFTVENRDAIQASPLAPVRVALAAHWNPETPRAVDAFLDAHPVDVAHVHNFFPVLSPSLHWALARRGMPVVQTLHNYRLLCVQGMFLRKDRVCEDCLGHVPWRGVVRRCYHDSAAQSAALAGVVTLHRALGTFRDRVTRYIALNEFCRRKFIEGGLPAARVVVKPNFVDVPPPPAAPRRGALFVGRLSAEKGIGTLLGALGRAQGVPLEVIGSGPEADRVAAHPQVRALGWLAQAQVLERMRAAAFLVLPSLWYECFPRTLVEAFACGLPVIASRIGALEELVEHGRTGLLFRPGSEKGLARSLDYARAHPEQMSEMGAQARAVYEARFSPQKNYEALMGIYAEAIGAPRAQAAA